MRLTPFHIAVSVRNIPEARDFYGNKLGFAEGRSTDTWIDFNMFGHQFVTHFDKKLGKTGQVPKICNPVDGYAVPVPHCGVVMELDLWKRFSERVTKVIDKFVIAPYTRFEGQPGAQATMFFLDPSGNALEFKAFKNIDNQLFEK